MYDCHQGIDRHAADVKRQNWHLARIFIMSVFCLMSALKMNGHKFITISHSVKNNSKPVDHFPFLLAVLLYR